MLLLLLVLRAGGLPIPEELGLDPGLDPGLDRRFPGRLHLDDYTPGELARIAKSVASGFGKTMSDEVVGQLEQHIADFYHREIGEQNGGLAVNLTEEAVQRQRGD